MSSNFFFKKKTVKLKEIFPNIVNSFIVNDVKPLHLAKKNDLTFFDSIRYKSLAIKTKGSACITTKQLEKYLPTNVVKIIVKNVLYELAISTKQIYPFSDIDYPDLSLKKPDKKNTNN